MDQLALVEEVLGQTASRVNSGGAAGVACTAYFHCPGAASHSTPSKPTDCQVKIYDDGRMPSVSCLHASCETALRTAALAIIHRIREAERAERGQSGRPAEPYRPTIVREPQPPAAELNVELATRFADGCPREITREFLRKISPLGIPAEPHKWPELFLDALYSNHDRILIFTKFASQGQFLRVVHGKNYALHPVPGRRAHVVPTLPDRGEDGVWFLASPVEGIWKENPTMTDHRTGLPKIGRRHAACCTSFPFAVLESDVIPEPTWLRILARLRDDIAAIYTSGGKSVHALLRLHPTPQSAEQFNAHRRQLIERLVPLGADRAALTAVRLTRLPGAVRMSKLGAGASVETPGAALQTLLYLNPTPSPGVRLCDMPEIRK